MLAATKLISLLFPTICPIIVPFSDLSKKNNYDSLDAHLALGSPLVLQHQVLVVTVFNVDILLFVILYKT